ncbi:hypothetical protein BD779DRAFT_1469302 [Infundibulicybe gibba]|nr:hypothetical protein BD779DRAFT_1469302 [Infundibulicybe gibba]
MLATYYLLPHASDYTTPAKSNHSDRGLSKAVETRIKRSLGGLDEKGYIILGLRDFGERRTRRIIKFLLNARRGSNKLAAGGKCFVIILFSRVPMSHEGAGTNQTRSGLRHVGHPVVFQPLRGEILTRDTETAPTPTRCIFVRTGILMATNSLPNLWYVLGNFEGGASDY